MTPKLGRGDGLRWRRSHVHRVLRRRHRSMLRTLLSPLSGRFAPSPIASRHENVSGASTNDEMAPEDFARDVLIEIMRKSVERLKFAEGLSARTEVSNDVALCGGLL